MKYIKSFIIFSLLVFVPLGSWYYLQTGLNYRKDALKDLEAKGLIKDLCDELEVYNGETTILAFANAVEDQNFESGIYKLLEGFDDVPRFGVLLVDEDSKYQKVERLKFQNTPIGCSNNFAAMTLIDTSGMIRMTYDDSQESFKKLVEHLAIVLPREKGKDIVKKGYEAQ